MSLIMTISSCSNFSRFQMAASGKRGSSKCIVRVVGKGPGGGKNCSDCHNVATLFCASCPAQYCAECDGLAHSRGPAKLHPARAPAEQAIELLVCQTHNDKSAGLFCKQCDAPLCEGGILDCHRAQHVVVSSEEADGAMRSRLAALQMLAAAEQQRNSTEHARLREAAAEADRRAEAMLAELQRGLLMNELFARLLDPKQSPSLSRAVAPHLDHIREFEAHTAARVLRLFVHCYLPLK